MGEYTRETGIDHIYGGSMYVSSSEAPVIARVLKIKENNPEEVTIIKMPEENDGCIYAKMPFSYMKLSAPKRIQLSDEERRIRSERLKAHRFQKSPEK